MAQSSRRREKAFRSRGAIALLATLWATSAARAHEADEALFLDEIPTISSASRYEQKATEAPASVSVVTSEEIARHGWRTLGEALAGLRGFYAHYDRNYSFVGVRGFLRAGDFNSRVLLLIDGHRLNDPIYEQAPVGTDFPLDLDLIERIEVVRGPGSALYGTDALLALVNVITKRGRDLQGAEISGAVAGFETHQARASFGRRAGDSSEFLLSASSYQREGSRHLYFPEFDDPATSFGVVRDRDGDDFHSAHASFGSGDLSLQATWISRDKEIPTASYMTLFADPREETLDQRLLLGATYTRDIAQDVRLTSRLSYGYYYYAGRYPYEDPLMASGTNLNGDFADAQWLSADLQASARPLDGHRLVFGAELRDAFRQDQGAWDETTTYFDDESDSTSYGIYGQDEVRVTDALRAVLGARFDHYDSFGGNLSPRVALVYDVRESTTLKLLYGEAFRAPNAYELNYSSLEIKTPDDLEPERARSFEAVAEHRFAGGFAGSLALFYYRARGVIELITDPSDGLFVYENGGSVSTRGLELELDGRLPGGFHGFGSYTYADTHDHEVHDDPPGTPSHLAELRFHRELFGGRLVPALEFQFGSARKTLSGRQTDAYLIANFSLGTAELLPGLRLSATVYNLFDTEVEHIGSEEHEQDILEQDGINYRLKLTYEF